ncbi:MAG: CoA transferase, partial [Butyrivibrio sp.]|nr:CoA transferase [Butyrivibrio sp.]
MSSTNNQALSGVKVVDLTYYVAGPGTAKILADWGADVIKIEPPGGEPGRGTGLTLGVPAENTFNPYFGTYNCNKRAIGLNLKTDEGKEILDKLLAEANVFVTSFRPGALQRLGLDYDTMKVKHPHIIWASINGFGELGPDKDKAGFDTVAFWAKSGAMIDLTEKDTSPINPTLAFGDAATACSLAGGICAALYKQAKTGEGSKIMLSLYSQAIRQLGSIISSSQIGDVYPKSRKDP